ncbi:MAG TPA: PAS domain S-box protein [Candidatus Acidoferrum sp.]|jgi:PAS domain S-box-containing protein|nr:PAS domain S-box protein [Candidatus Acidoferrum sp.]
MSLNKPLHLLHLEDDPDFSDLVVSLLKQAGLPAELLLVGSRLEFEEALAEGKYDAILADYSLPEYNGLEALQAARAKCPETPFLLVSGTIGEEAAIRSLKNGATDYVLKLWPERLVPALRRAVQEAEERRQRRHIETELMRREKYFRALTENCLDILTILNREGVYLYNSPSLMRVLGYAPGELAGRSAFSLVHPDDVQRVMLAFNEGLHHPERTIRLEFRFQHRDGSWRDLEAVGRNRFEDPEIGGMVVNSRDVTDRIRAESDLRESERQYRVIFDGNATPMWIFERETLAFLEANDAALQHYGYSREEFLRLTLPEITLAEDMPAMIGYLHKLTGDQALPRAGFFGIWRHHKRDGTPMDVEVKWSPISFQGRPASLCMINDITERRRIEHRDAAFSKLGQHLSSATCPAEAARIIKSAAEDLFRWDAFTLDLYAGEQDRVYPILNVDTNLAGERFEVGIDGRGHEPSARARRIIGQGGELILREEPITMPPGVRPFGDTSRPSASLALVPIRNRTKVIGILSIQSYTTKAYDQRDLATLQTLADHCGGALERLRAEQALHSSEMLFHSVWENSVDGMRLTDEHGTIVAVNGAFCQLVGMAREELEGKPLTVTFAESENTQSMLAQYQERFQGRVTERQIERRLTLHDGRGVTFEETDSFLELSDAAPLLLGLFRDVTAQKQLEDQLRQAQKMEAIGQLAGGVAHDFNNILTIIHGHASLLVAAGKLEGASARSAQQITQAAERAASLTRQLLTFSRRQVMQPRPLDLNGIVSNMTQMLGRILGEDIALKLDYAPQPAMVQADAGMMEQVLMNLVVNSRDAMPGGGALTICLSSCDVGPLHLSCHPEARAGRFVCLRVADTGCGIPPENLRRIFDPFFTTKEVGKGTGLGLATVYGIVNQHQGWIEVTSRVGQGTAFEVFLPCSARATEPVREEPAGRAVRGGTETILVVEDEAPVRELVCSLLAGHGYKILQAESGVKALEVWKQCRDRVDLVLTDLVMPDLMNGRELAEKLLSERPELKVIFTSGYSADVVGKDFVLREGLSYLQKPYHPDKLALVVRDCLDAVN